MDTLVQNNRTDPENWVEQHGNYLYRYALVRLRNPQLAEEVVQETYLAAFQAHKKFAGQSSERTWLVGILKHKVFDHFRKAAKEVSLEDAGILSSEEDFRTSGEWIGHWTEKAAPMDWGPNPNQLLENLELREVLNRCLASMPPRLAQVFILRELEEMTTGDICELLSISESNLWVMLHRARMQLRRYLELSYFRPRQDKQKNARA